jgi:hypothetical protein
MRKKDSRKKNSNLFNGKGYCNIELCPVFIEVEVADEPRNKSSPCLFKVTVWGNANHDSQKKTGSRQLTGAAREAMGMFAFFVKNNLLEF